MAIGLLLSIGIGGLVSHYFRNWRNNRIKSIGKDSDVKKADSQNIQDNILSITTGVIERTFFTILVADDVSGASVAMMGWLAVKMATNWNRIPEDTWVGRAMSMTALQSGMVSLLFALVGGLIIRG